MRASSLSSISYSSDQFAHRGVKFNQSTAHTQDLTFIQNAQSTASPEASSQPADWYRRNKSFHRRSITYVSSGHQSDTTHGHCVMATKYLLEVTCIPHLFQYQDGFLITYRLRPMNIHLAVCDYLHQPDASFYPKEPWCPPNHLSLYVMPNTTAKGTNSPIFTFKL